MCNIFSSVFPWENTILCFPVLGVEQGWSPRNKALRLYSSLVCASSPGLGIMLYHLSGWSLSHAVVHFSGLLQKLCMNFTLGEECQLLGAPQCAWPFWKSCNFLLTESFIYCASAVCQALCSVLGMQVRNGQFHFLASEDYLSLPWVLDCSLGELWSKFASKCNIAIPSTLHNSREMMFLVPAKVFYLGYARRMVDYFCFRQGSK